MTIILALHLLSSLNFLSEKISMIVLYTYAYLHWQWDMNEISTVPTGNIQFVYLYTYHYLPRLPNYSSEL